MTEQEQQKRWNEIYQHSAYLPWREYIAKWSIEAGSRNPIEKAQWCCDNIRGFFSIRNTTDRTVGKIFFFNKEEDAVAFKLRWV